MNPYLPYVLEGAISEHRPEGVLRSSAARRAPNYTLRFIGPKAYTPIGPLAVAPSPGPLPHLGCKGYDPKGG
jgi:hypothetical protein